MEITVPEKFSIVAFWTRDAFLRNCTFDHVPNYILLGPTGPTKAAYYAKILNGYVTLQNTKNVRIKVKDMWSPDRQLVTKEEYQKLWYRAQQDHKNQVLLNILSRE